ncbi:MAG: IS1380 family transposase [Actinomycetota bacterium]|nr:IS1380 family transposase [Actinomycetota bacterium]
MKRSAASGRVKVTADGEGVVSHAGAELLREVAQFSGLTAAWDAALLGTYKALPIHFPGRVLCDIAVAIADGADSISDLQVLRDHPQLFGPVASTPTAWRVLDRVSEAHLPLLRRGRALARKAAWAAGAGPDLSEELCLDIDATIVIAHSDKQTAEPTWKKTFGHHPLLCFLDRPEVSSGEALSGILRPGGAGSNTAQDHMLVLDLALESLPEEARPSKDSPGGPRLLVRCDAAGATHDFADHCRTLGVAFSFGFRVTQEVRDAVVDLDADEWWEAIDTDEGDLRDGAWAAEVTEILDLEAWPKGSRVVVRRERPHPGAQLSLFDLVEGFRHTAFIFAPPREDDTIAIGIDHLELRHRRHARVEDRIRQGKAAGLHNFPCKETAENNAWLELVLTAADLVCWSKLLCFHDEPELARCEIASFRYRILHMAARLTRSGRVTSLRLDRTWSWAKQLALAFSRLRTAFA